MKRILSLLLLCLLLLPAGCSQSAQPEPAISAAASAPAAEPETPALPKEQPAPDPEPAVTPVEVTHGEFRIGLDIPEGWEYEVEEYSEETGLFGLRFRPEGADGWVRLECCDWFGVCGTGLEMEEITFPSGLTGEMGTYDGGQVWDFIAFSAPEGATHTYVASAEQVEDWWPDHGDTAMEILSTARLG